MAAAAKKKAPAPPAPAAVPTKAKAKAGHPFAKQGTAYVPIAYANPRCRWERVQYLAGTDTRRPDKTDDADVISMYRFMCAHNKIVDGLPDGDIRFDTKMRQLVTANQAEADVLSIYVTAGLMRHVLEALMLTDASDEEMSREMAIAQETVRLYRSMFMDVSRVKHSRCALMHWVFDGAVLNSISSDDHDKLLKAVALFGSKDMLYAILNCGEISDPVAEQLAAWIKGQGYRNTLKASNADHADRFSAATILERHNDSQRVDMERVRLERDAYRVIDHDVEAELRAIVGAFKLSLFSASGIALPKDEVPETRAVLKLLRDSADYGTQDGKDDKDLRTRLIEGKKP